MKKCHLLLATVMPIVILGSACDSFASKEALLDKAANFVIAKYQNASCEEVAQMQPQSDPNAQSEEGLDTAAQAKAMEILQNNPELREEFINRVAGPIANRMFECDLIP